MNLFQGLFARNICNLTFCLFDLTLLQGFVNSQTEGRCRERDQGSSGRLRFRSSLPQRRTSCKEAFGRTKAVAQGKLLTIVTSHALVTSHVFLCFS